MDQELISFGKAQRNRENPDGKNWYLSNFEMFEKSLNGEVASRIHRIRKEAISRFAELGFPTTHDEEWKYTDVSSIAKVPFRLLIGNEPDQSTARGIERLVSQVGANVLVCVNGHFSEKLSSHPNLPASVSLSLPRPASCPRSKQSLPLSIEAVRKDLAS